MAKHVHVCTNTGPHNSGSKATPFRVAGLW